jgi:hypothetical protein
MKPMKDQYGTEVPSDLVVLPFGAAPGKDVIHFDALEPEEVEVISAAAWYEVEGQEGLILASAEFLGGFGSDPEDCGIGITPETKINRIADVLKRYSWEDGFYHA